MLSLKRNIEEQIQFKFAREQMIFNNHRTRLAGLEDDRLRLAQAMEERMKKKIDGPTFLFFMESMRVQELRIRILQNTIAAQQQVVDKIRLELSEAMKQRKIIEALREKDLQHYLRESRRKEQNESDEQALLRYGRGTFR